METRSAAPTKRAEREYSREEERNEAGRHDRKKYLQGVARSLFGVLGAGLEMTDGVHWADVFTAGGILTTYAMGRKTTGTWRVEKDQLCVDRGKDDGGRYRVWLAGKKVELRHEGFSLPLEGILQKPVSRN